MSVCSTVKEGKEDKIKTISDSIIEVSERDGCKIGFTRCVSTREVRVSPRRVQLFLKINLKNEK